MSKTPNRQPKAMPGAVRAYLVTYNLVCFLGWLRILIGIIQFMVQGSQSRPIMYNWSLELLERVRPLMVTIAPPSYRDWPFPVNVVLQRASGMHAYVGSAVLVMQSTAVLEVVHALLGWVKANPMVVAMQVASRVLILWFVSEQYQAAATSPFYALMVFAWSLSEVARYPFYVNQLLDSQSYMALWARYSMFTVLFPLGVLGEVQLIWASLPTHQPWPWVDPRGWSLRDLTFLAVLPTYAPGLYILYTGLLATRRKVLGNDFLGTKARDELRRRQAEHFAKISRPLHNKVE